ncbi:response regulator [Microscilla marina]|uniref:Response regulator receiver domain protein n=1 Tax=Microscilla marina ATCC 23134 TaxID=313606 RepID=A1ZC64_MICM2|nr:response regulator [Microscilla marina]EAY31866.1 response regulator receiver domain protein [Microscilla marina ATCC 23134]
MATGEILLIEDNEDDVLLTKRALRKHHIKSKVVVACNGKEGLDYLLGKNGKQKLSPMLTLLDLNLPIMGGLDVLEALQRYEQPINCPIIVLTTSDNEEDIASCYRLGAHSYVQKPMDLTQFMELIRYLAIYWLALNKPYPVVEGGAPDI